MELDILTWLALWIIGATLLPGFLSLIATGIVFGTTFFLMSLTIVYFQFQVGYYSPVIVFAALSIVLTPRTRRIFRQNTSRQEWQKTQDYFLIGLGLYFLTSYLIPPVIGWDARSIWLLHAKWLQVHGMYEIFQIQPVNIFSHPDYPIAGSSTLSRFLDKSNQYMNYGSAIRGIAFVSFCLKFYVAYFISREYQGTFNFRRLLLVASFSSFLILDNGYGLSSGYMDEILSISVVAIAIIFIRSFKERLQRSDKLFLAMIGIYLVGLKQEGVVSLGILYFSWFVANSRQIKKCAQLLKWMVPGVGVWLSWILYLRINKIPLTSDASGILENLAPSKTNLSTGTDTLITYFQLGGFHEVCLALVVCLGIFLLMKSKTNFETQKSLFFITAIVTHEILLILVYCFGSSRLSIEWWMTTSFSRITSTAHALMILGVLLAILSNESDGHLFQKFRRNSGAPHRSIRDT